MESNVLGIDLGTCNCCVSVFHNGRPEPVSLDGMKTIPSVITFYDNKIEYGSTAKKNRFDNGAMPVYELKRLFGIPYEQYHDQHKYDMTTYQVKNKDGRIVLCLKGDKPGKWYIDPEHVYSMLLSYLVQCASKIYGRCIRDAVITVPANFTPIQIHQTVLSAEMAGLNVLRIVYEPNAAALACHDKIPQGVHKVLLCDVGGGTTDITLMNYNNNAFSIVKTSGNAHLGGCDFDERLARLFCDKIEQRDPRYHVDPFSNEFIRILEMIEPYKLELSSLSGDQAVEFDVNALLGRGFGTVSISSNEFTNKCDDLFDQIVRLAQDCVRDQKWNIQDIGAVLLVGGSSRLPQIERRFKKVFSFSKLILLDDPDTIVSLGACLVAKDELARRQTGVSQLPVQFVNLLAFDLTCSQGGERRRIFSQRVDEEAKLAYSSLDVKDNTLKVFMPRERVGNDSDLEIGFFEITCAGDLSPEPSDYRNDAYGETLEEASEALERRSQNEVTIRMDSRVELQMTLSLGGSGGHAPFIYHYDMNKKDRKYITSLNSIYEMIREIKARYNGDDVARLIQAWEDTEVKNRFRLHSIDVEKSKEALERGLHKHYSCLLQTFLR